MHPGAKSDPSNFGQPYYDVDELNFPVENGKTARVPYLPDPVSKGAAFVGLPAAEALKIPTKVSFTAGKQWPEVNTFLLRVEEGATQSHDFGRSTLRVSLPKADVVEVDYSSYHEAEDIAKLGLMRWIAKAADNPKQDDEVDEDEVRRLKFVRWMNQASRRYKGRTAARGFELPSLELMRRVADEAQSPRFWSRASEEMKHLARIVAGTHVMAMPARKLILVHAVRQPLLAPAFKELKLARSLGQTYVTLSDGHIFDAKGTAEIDVRGKWVDVFDQIDGTTGAWEPKKEIPVEGIAFNHKVVAPPGRARLFRGRHEFYDTKYREVTYRTIATTRFKDYFTDHRTIRFDNGGEVHALPPDPRLLGAAGVVRDSEKVKSVDGKVTYVKDTDYEMDYDAGTIRRKGGGIPINTDLRVDYISPPITRESEDVVLTVPNSARPAAPKLLYIVPTFQWERSETPTSKTSQRKGRGLRIYLDRPWWSSGAGEQLGVLVYPKQEVGRPTKSPSEKIKPFITRWGLDPLWLSEPTTSLPEGSDFPLRVGGTSREVDLKFTIEEMPEVKVAVVGHDVGFDEELNLWYCDIIMDTDAYFPFVKLALARYQPNSLDDAHLSRVVAADFIQLTPDRSLTMTLDPTDPHLVNISLAGRSYRASELGDGPAEVEVTIERLRPEVPDPNEALAWVPIDGSETILESGFDRSGIAVWSGQLSLPESVGGQPLRLVIREFERIIKQILTKPLPAVTFGRRLVYAETVQVAGPKAPTPADLTVGATTATSFTVNNLGGDAGPFVVELRSPQGTVLQTVDFPGLAAGASDTRQVASSNQVRTVVVDPSNRVPESDEANNTGSIPATLPDLVVSATTTTSFTVANVGGGASGPFEVRLSSPQGTILQTFTNPGLVAGASFTQQVASSSQQRTVLVDSQSQVPESNESNNTGIIPAGSSPSPTTTSPPPSSPPPSSPAPRPDLVISATTTTSYTVSNQGNAAAGGFAVVVRNTSGQTLQTFQHTGLAVGASQTQTLQPSASAREAVADSGSAVVESNETNNTRAIPAAQLPDLVISATSTGSFTVSNVGQAAAGAFSVKVAEPNTTGTSYNFSGLAAGQSITQQIPGHNKERIATADSLNQVTESNENNNTRAVNPSPN